MKSKGSCHNPSCTFLMFSGAGASAGASEQNDSFCCGRFLPVCLMFVLTVMTNDTFHFKLEAQEMITSFDVAKLNT